MKRMYWQQKILPRFIIIGFCLTMIASLAIVEHFLSNKKQAYHQQKLTAAEDTYQAFQQIRRTRQLLDIPINPTLDRTGLGLIGHKSSSITTDAGTLYAKRTSVNPNIAALFIQWFDDAKLHQGDTVAVAMTGSFPAANIALLIAMKTWGLKPLIILSAGASNYGANIPGFCFVDMYQVLYKQHFLNVIPLAVSLGGSQDRAYGMSPFATTLLKNTIQRAGYPFLHVNSTHDSIKKRMQLYRKAAANNPIRAYINVGGGMASIGLKKVKHTLSTIAPKPLPTGVHHTLPIFLTGVNSVAVQFLKQGVAVINFKDIKTKIATHYKLPYNPLFMPPVGTGSMFIHPEYNRLLAFSVLLIDSLILLFLAWFSRRYLITYKK